MTYLGTADSATAELRLNGTKSIVNVGKALKPPYVADILAITDGEIALRLSKRLLKQQRTRLYDFCLSRSVTLQGLMEEFGPLRVVWQSHGLEVEIIAVNGNEAVAYLPMRQLAHNITSSPI
jgi:hypothetical protein